MSARKKRPQADRLNAFDDKTDLEQVADEIFGASAAPELNTGRIVARPTRLNEIWADVRQPRRAIPASIRLVWNGSPTDVPQLLDTWAAVAANAAGRVIDIQAIIQGDGEGVDTDGTPPIYESFISLLRLAGSILREGLINPITIIDQRDRHIIESGERRWLAYWLLHLHTQARDEFARIPAATASGADYIWRQAAENTARRSLNAVGMSRQLALLIMAARGQDQYADYEMIVAPGGSDRRFYAQVADGNVHRIPKGSAERIEAAMGLSKEQLSRYRDILHITQDEEINDLLWLRGDIEDWPELAFRDAKRLPIVNLRTIISRDAWSYPDFRVWPSATFQTAAPDPVGTRRALSDPPPAQSQYAAAEAEEAHRILDAIRQGFARVYAMGGSIDGVEQIAANRATRLLNQAQLYYEKNRLVSAKAELDEAFRILGEAAAAVDTRITPEPKGMSEYEEKKILKWAWRWAMGHLDGDGWFTYQDCQTEHGQLGTLVLKNYLQQGTTRNGDREIVRYRITPAACRYLGVGFDMIDWDAREQVSDGPESPHQKAAEGVEDGSASDKSPSDGSEEQLVVEHNTQVFTLLMQIRTLAGVIGHTDTFTALDTLFDMNWDTARQLATDGQLTVTLDDYYDRINKVLEALAVTLGDFLGDLNEQLAE